MNPQPPVLYSVEAGIARLVLNRPDDGNAISLAFCAAFADAVEQIARADLRVLVISANGPRFCSGGDIGEFVENRKRLPEHIGAMLERLNPAMKQLASLPVPVVSVVHGSAGGAGIALACCADFVLASDRVRVRGGYTAIGLTPDIGASYHVAQRIGAARAKRLFILNETFDARQCLAMGLFDQLHAPGELAGAAEALIRTLACGATTAFGLVKQLCDGAAGRDVQTHLDIEGAALLASTRSADAREGVQAFIEKREPRFTGHPLSQGG
ncbi:enoyl-CoA hydratase/isomerase family protein [Pseudomonas jinjuensis]|uniref:2-(1,2-epoxy-1,2-dihydrophenyl)acetyl-CoA isomerase n=1 Tax=Pseudomonas jinjuensis TaxID=198616 RepID=A0A1G9YPX7_9PSED|nr:enoyl-CoA hydratase-related protein [Pseudomonas jinjuensis]SDN10563.1 2-(1,2-epoxy-1,2-dihydrophenyl)acetyl-CoA isomerase [Pseudomonas jinjuensis]